MSSAGDESGDGDIVFNRLDDDEAASHDDVWDDSLLIKMYDRAVSLTYDKVREQMDMDSPSSSSASPAKKAVKQQQQHKSTASQKVKKAQAHSEFTSHSGLQWKVGDRCLAPYYENNLWYEASIVAVDSYENTAEVKYDGYDDTETVDMDDLCRPAGKKVVAAAVDRRQKRLLGSAYHRKGSRKRIAVIESSSSTQRKSRKRPYWRIRCPSKMVEIAMQAAAIERLAATAAAPTTSAEFGRKDAYLENVTAIFRNRFRPEATAGDEAEMDGDLPESGNENQPMESKPLLKKSPIGGTQLSGPPIAPIAAPIPQLAPPPPPMFAQLGAPVNEDEALAGMLMSWYMSGYHTGYYQAMQDAKKKTTSGQ